MKQIFENLRNGEIEFFDVPLPNVGRGKVLVKNYYSLISSGTEKGLLEFGTKNLLEKAKARPDLVMQVLEKVRTEGILTTYQKAMQKLEDFLPLGYSCAGQVVEIGKGVKDFNRGDMVACAGSGYANHAEYVSVPENLVVKIPQGVSPEEASFVAFGSIALHGIRQSGANLGDFVAVVGLGLIGLITVQLLKSCGCKVIGLDVDSSKRELALQLGVDLFVDLKSDNFGVEVASFTNGVGVDEVLMTASTDSNTPVELVPQIIRDRGTLVIVGVSKIDIPRNPYYKKEITVKFSRSYGPGRYDPTYEENGVDYPVGYVRWTEKRNMEAFLSLISSGQVNLKPLISCILPIEKYREAYDLILGKVKSDKKVIAVMFEYSKDVEIKKITFLKDNYKKIPGKVGVSIIGSGNFTKSTLLPNLSKLKEEVDLLGISSQSGGSAGVIANRYRFKYATSDYREILQDPQTDLIFITVPHNLHASIASEALRGGKDVFVEKPLAINLDQLKEIVKAKEESGRRVMVGFNRRFSPLTQWIRDLLGNKLPLIISYRINAGIVPAHHWINDPDVGGGRIIGEVCHFIDFMIYMFNSQPLRVFGSCVRKDHGDFLPFDNCAFNIEFENGSVGNIIYESIGPEVLPKERVEILGDNFGGIIDNFIRAEFYKGGKVVRKRLFAQDKGFLNEYREVIKSIKSGRDFHIPFEDFVYTTLTTFALEDSIRSGQPVKIDGNIWREK